MAWPTAHRNGGALARQGGGFQTRGFQPRSTPYSPIRTPLGPPPVPGNDNFPWRPPPPAGLPFGKRGGGGGKGGGGGFRRYVRRNKWMRRLIRWNPVLDYVWDWYNYVNPEPVANQRPDNTGWVLTWKCKDSYGENLRQYPGNTCPVYQPTDVTKKLLRVHVLGGGRKHLDDGKRSDHGCLVGCWLNGFLGVTNHRSR